MKSLEYNFAPTRGLCQGDPLSPYLFINALEGLSKLFSHAEVSNKFSGVIINKNYPIIFHLLFADDCFIFSKVDLAEFRKLMNILDIFSSS